MKKMGNKILLLFLIGLGSISIIAVQGNGEIPIRFLVAEQVNLRVDGSITPVLINLTKDFDHVMRFVWNLIWVEQNINFDDFGTKAGPLTNGTEFLYNGTNVNGNITAIKDFGSASYDVRIDSDEVAQTKNHLYSRLSFTKITNINDGLDVHNFDLQFRVNDNITDVCEEFFVFVEGYKLIIVNEQPEQAPISPWAYFDRWALWMFSQPITFFAIILSGVVIFVLLKRMRTL